MNFIVIGMLIMQAARLACGTCVLESDFGFILNCNFKKSGLFRVRNLGGLKAHFGLGFSLGDELGFPESLGNVEGGRRRSIGYKNGPPPNSAVGVLPANQQPSAQSLMDKRIQSRSPMVLSPELRESLQKQAKAAAAAEMLARQNAGADNLARQQALNEMLVQQKRQAELRAQQAALREMAAKKAQQKNLMTEARPLPLGVPAFKPIPQKQLPAVPFVSNHLQHQQQMAERRSQSVAVDTPHSRMSVNNKLVDMYTQQLNNNRTFHPQNAVMISKPMAVPAFQAMPSSVNKITAVLKTPNQSVAPQATVNHPNYLQFEEPKFDMKDITVEELAKAANVSVDTIKHAIYVREQQLKAEHRAMLAAKLREEFMRTSSTTTTTTTSTTTSTTTTPRPVAKHYVEEHNFVQPESKKSKVMNAPKEYYPVGYDKNFDDNFKSKVDLPPTSFSCAKQKHFPGLYADTDLGCMVFHVCALTDDGMVRKSFLCPENTLFDQTILKCNWWFYVDCAQSKSIYDSNIPISKSYQLMKSLTYFSKYNKQSNGDDEGNDNGRGASGGLDIQSLKDSMDEETRKTTTTTTDRSDDDAPQSGAELSKFVNSQLMDEQPQQQS
ncbi:mind the gap [Musca autumnalis]|uniref:mind the gap n=1 Tax=Musca autumnalis TaxID=221902 RepID=UPI003CEBF972